MQFTAPALTQVVGEAETKDDKAAAASGVNVKDPGDRAAYVAKLYDQSLTLELLTWIGTLTHLPIVVKGVLRGDSAALAAAHPNVRGIIVSNHGGRQLDNCLAPLTALSDCVTRVNAVNLTRAEQGLQPVEIIVDGGVTRGRDIFKALALGAKAVMVGRPMIYGMAVGGELGVARTVELLREELKTTRNARKRTRKDQIAGRMSQAAAHFAVDLNFEHMMNHKEVKSIGTQAPSDRPLARLRPSPLGAGAHDVWRELWLFLSFPASSSRVGTGFGYRGCS